MISKMDKSVGEVVKSLSDKNMLENTLIGEEIEISCQTNFV
jgi:hypothetical protein